MESTLPTLPTLPDSGMAAILARFKPPEVVAVQPAPSTSEPAPAAVPAFPADPRTAAALVECEAIIDAGLTARLTPAQRSVAEVLRSVVRAHAAKLDPALWEDAEVLRKQFARWEQGR
jgi:hypothetical protein